MIELNAITKAFNQGRPNEYWAVRGVDLTVEHCKITVLKGPSGSGKTTLLSMIGCLSRPTSGRITFGNRILSGLPERFMTEVRRRTFGFVFQQFNLIKGLTVLENIVLPAYPLAPDHRILENRARDLLDEFGLAEHAYHRTEWLSGGEAQRTAICRALINDPQVLIADEPTANLDTTLSHGFMRLVRHLVDRDKTVLLSSHDPIVYEASEVDRVVEMRDGRILET